MCAPCAVFAALINLIFITALVRLKGGEAKITKPGGATAGRPTQVYLQQRGPFVPQPSLEPVSSALALTWGTISL